MKRITYCLAGLFLFCQSAVAQLRQWQKGVLVDEFLYDTAAFPQCHAATIAETPKGLVAAFFGGTREGAKDVEIYVCRMVNGRWTPPVSAADGIINDTLRKACYNPVLYRVPGGELMLFYKIGRNVADWTGWVKRSNDNGQTWSKAVALPTGFLGPIKNKPVLLSNGHLLAPSSTEGNGWKVHFEISADKGLTWRKVGPIHDGKTLTAIQPSVLFHKDGSLQMLARSKDRAIIESWSKDNGEAWSPVQKSSLPNNNSGTDAVTLKDGRQLLVYNHVLPHDSLKNGKGARTPLNVAVSKDGKKWYAAAILEDSPISQYSYPSVIQSADGMVHIVYTWRRLKVKYVKLDPSKLVLKEIVAGQWPAMAGYTTPTNAEINKD